MKCSYCGRENDEEAARCFECGTGLRLVTQILSQPVQQAPREPKPPVALAVRLGLCAGAWGSVMVLVLAGGVATLPFALAGFAVTTPPGALAAQATHMTRYQYPLGNWIAWGSGWLYYVLLTFLALRCSRRKRFFSVYLILCGSLLFSSGAYIIMRYFYRQ